MRSKDWHGMVCALCPRGRQSSKAKRRLSVQAQPPAIVAAARCRVSGPGGSHGSWPNSNPPLNGQQGGGSIVRLKRGVRPPR